MCEADCEKQLLLVRAWLSEDHFDCAKWLVDNYQQRPGGAAFDRLARTTAPNAIEDDDLAAVRSLSIRFPKSFLDCLKEAEVRELVESTLEQIPTDKHLEDLTCEEYADLLGPNSVAWSAWW
jgi:hypothetical protein